MRSKKEREKIQAREGESPPLLFIAFFTSHRSPLSERLEQASSAVGSAASKHHFSEAQRDVCFQTRHVFIQLYCVLHHDDVAGILVEKQREL